MNKLDELYYRLKELNQSLDFYQHKADHKVRGAKVKVRNLKSLISDTQEDFILEEYKQQLKTKPSNNEIDYKVNVATWSNGY